MVIIYRDVGYFMLALFYLENLMGDFQYKMEFSIKVKGDTAHLQCFSVYLPCHFFSGIEVRLCILSGQKMLVICKDMDAVSVDMQPCMDALVVYVNSMMYLPNHIMITNSSTVVEDAT